MASGFLSTYTRRKKYGGRDILIPKENGFLPKSPYPAKLLMNYI